LFLFGVPLVGPYLVIQIALVGPFLRMGGGTRSVTTGDATDYA